MYSYTSEQNLPIDTKKAWEFLSDPKNLKTITPDYMGFDIISGADRKMFPGQIIQPAARHIGAKDTGRLQPQP